MRDARSKEHRPARPEAGHLWEHEELPRREPQAGASTWSSTTMLGQAPQDSDGLWARLLVRLLPIVERRVKDRHLAEDVASEVALHTWQKFGRTCRQEDWHWPDVWHWSLSLVRHLTARAWRDGRRRQLSTCSFLDAEFLAPASADGSTVVEAHDLAECLLARVGLRERETLALLRAGPMSNSELAVARGISLASAERSRRRLRAAADAVQE